MPENFEPTLFDQLEAPSAPVTTPLPSWAKKLAVFDLETTGLDLATARIVTACVVLIDEHGQVASQELEWLANPGVPIPEQASNVHGVTDEIANTRGRPAQEVVAEILEALRGYFAEGIPVVAYNAPYDFTILQAEALRYSLSPVESPKPVMDPLILDRQLDKYRAGKRNLEVVAAHYGVSLSDAHNATADAVAAGRVLQAIARKYQTQLPATAQELHDQQVGWSEAQDSNFEEFRRRTLPDFQVVRGWPLKPLK